MYWYEKDYIMRLIHGIALVLARMLMGKQEDGEAEQIMLQDESARDREDYLHRMIDEGRVNEAEEALFDLLETAAWDDREKAALALSFYDHLNSKDDEFLEKAKFPREEIIRGMEDALRIANMEIPEYLKIN